MNTIPSIGIGVSLLCSMLPSAMAAGLLVRNEPENGFLQGEDPEWSSAHQTAPSDMQDHRQYHRDAEVARVAWMSLHASEQGTSAYDRAHRLMVQERNMLHRQYHLGLHTESSAFNANRNTFSAGVSSSASSLSSHTNSSFSQQQSSFSSTMSSMSSSSSMSSIHSSSSSSSSQSSSIAAHQEPVSLGAASTFGVLAGSTVTNSGPTTVNGDLGVSPGSAVTGFPPGIVNGGGMHATDTAADQAKAALTVAYNDLAGRTLAPVSVSGNLGGSTLSAGLYKSTSGLEISTGDLTLDAKGDSNAIFIFQIATTLNVSTGRSVTLIGGAKASNVFWQVGTSANLEANCVFMGSILADQSISLQTGARVDGRLLARIGGVTLQGNTVTVPN